MLLGRSCMSYIVLLITKTCSNTNDFNALISEDRERSFLFRFWPRVTCSFLGLTIGASSSNNGTKYGSSGEAESSGNITGSSIKHYKFLPL